MYKKCVLSFIFVLALCWPGALANNSTCVTDTTWSNSSSSTTITELDITYPTSLNVLIELFNSTNGELDVTVEGCSTDADDSTLESLIYSLTAAGDSFLLALNFKTEIHSSAATKGSLAAPLTLVAVLATLFAFFPKKGVSILVLVAVLCIATSYASSPATVTIKVYLPPQIVTVCENGQCKPVIATTSSITSTTAGSTSSASSTTTSDSGSGSTSGSNTVGSGSSTTAAAATTTTTTTTSSSSVSTSTTTGASAPPAGSILFNLRVLIMAIAPLFNYSAQSSHIPAVTGADFATLAFASMGTPYDYLVVNSTVDLSSYLSTSGTGLYSGIVTVSDSLLTPTQKGLVTAYQNYYGVKWAIIGSSGNVDGVLTAVSTIKTNFNLTLAPQFADYAQCLQPTISVNNSYAINWSGYRGLDASLVQVTITNSAAVTPVILAQLPGGAVPAAVAIKMPNDGTEQLHYLVSQTPQYIHSMAFAPILVNWLSPGSVFMGARRLSLLVQPDDLFLGSYLWDIETHTNPVLSTSPWYRMSADDLQGLADFFDDLNGRLPNGSYVTVEWPTNFGGINDYYTLPGTDDLWLKALAIQDKFYYLSHTWDHPCTFDNVTAGNYTVMYSELAKNKAYVPTFFGNNGTSRWSSSSMITPCVTGLYNAGALQALIDNGITACVSDESVTKGIVDYEPQTPYHGVWSTVARNGIAGVYFVPRETLDIDYCDKDDKMVVDEYHTTTPGTDSLTFEDIMALQTMYGVQDKIAFRHDPFMLHQTNGALFPYTAPGATTARNTSLIAMFIQNVVDEMMTYFNLPIVTHQMDTVVKMFQQRDTMDACGITTTLVSNANQQLVGVQIISTNTCQMSLSGVTLYGPTVTMETYATETTSWIQLTANTQQYFSFSPISM